MRKFIAAGTLALVGLFGAAACSDGKTATGTAAHLDRVADEPTAPASSSTPSPTDTPTPTPSPEPPATPTGDDDSVFALAPGTALNVQSTDPAGTATVTVRGPVQVTPAEYDETPTGHLIGLKVTMTTLTGVFDLNPYDFDLRAEDGTTIDQGFTVNPAYPMIDSGTARAGRSIAGWLVFDVPAGYHGELEYAPGLNDVLGSWTITG